MTARSKYLLDKHPILISPDLACVIGLNEAIVLQQVHYWLVKNKEAGKNTRDGKVWTYNSMEQWQTQFPFWSVATVKRTFDSLKKKDLLLTANYNALRMDQTKWYTINYESLNTIVNYPAEAQPFSVENEAALLTCSAGAMCPEQSLIPNDLKPVSPSDQIETMQMPIMTKAIPETNTEINQETIYANNASTRAMPTMNEKTRVPVVALPDHNITSFMKWYYGEYKRRYGEPHPTLSIEQRISAHNTLLAFCTENDLEMDNLHDMAVRFFNEVANSDHHISHFATPGILEISFWRACY